MSRPWRLSWSWELTGRQQTPSVAGGLQMPKPQWQGGGDLGHQRAWSACLRLGLAGHAELGLEDDQGCVVYT